MEDSSDYLARINTSWEIRSQIIRDKIFREVASERDIPELDTSWGWIWSLGFWYWSIIELIIAWSISYDFVRSKRIPSIRTYNLLREAWKVSPWEDILEGSSGTDILEIQNFVHILSWWWALVKSRYRGNELCLIIVWKGHNLEEINVEGVLSM